MKKAIFLAIALTLFAAPAFAQCALDTQLKDLGQSRSFELSFQRVPQATGYIIEEAVEGQSELNHTELSQDQTVVRFKRTFSRETTFNTIATYRVIALGVPSCTDERLVLYKFDPTFKKAMTRSIIPLVGSTPGAFGAQFKTSLRLRATDAGGQNGKLIFHPIGVPATNADPFIRYELPNQDSVQEWDDIVAAFGATGLGSIDIVPDIVSSTARVMAPRADVHLFNVTPNGTFGTLESQTQPFSFHEDNPSADAGLRVTMPTTDLRLNVGVRTFLESEVDVVVERGGQIVSSRLITLPADILQFMPASAFAGFDVQPGDEVFVRVRGAGVPIYSLTDNKTNDPALFVPPARIDQYIDKYQIVH